jgi:hypothetical protein
MSHVFHPLRCMQETRSRSTRKTLKTLGKWQNT